MNHEQHTLSKAQGLGDNKGSGRHACIYLQIMLRYPEAKLLLCAPQNYSADLLASALRKAGVTAADMLRLNDPRLPPNQVSIPPQHMSNIVSQDCWMPSCRSAAAALSCSLLRCPMQCSKGRDNLAQVTFLHLHGALCIPCPHLPFTHSLEVTAHAGEGRRAAFLPP